MPPQRPRPQQEESQPPSKKPRRSPLYRRFLDQQREIEKQRTQLAANLVEIREYHRLATAENSQRERRQGELNDYSSILSTTRKNVKRLAANLAKKEREVERLTAVKDQLETDRTNLHRLISILQSHSSTTTNQLIASEAVRRRIHLPTCPPRCNGIARALDLQSLDTWPGEPTRHQPRYTCPANHDSVADSLSRPSETIRVSGNSARLSRTAGPGLQSLSTFEGRLVALERSAASASVVAKDIQILLPHPAEPTLQDFALDAEARVRDALDFLSTAPSSLAPASAALLIAGLFAAFLRHG